MMKTKAGQRLITGIFIVLLLSFIVYTVVNVLRGDGSIGSFVGAGTIVFLLGSVEILLIMHFRRIK